LDLTADQKEKINKISDDAAAEARAAMPGGGGGIQQMSQEERQAWTTASRNRTTKANDAIKAVLTDAQKKKMDELTAAAPAVREKLNLNQPGGQGGGRQGGGRQGA
jgi:hypothetical protein